MMKAKICQITTLKAGTICSRKTFDLGMEAVRTVSAVIRRYNGGVTKLYLIVAPTLVWVTDFDTKDLTVLSNTNWNVN